jgi:hypothetical protein
VEPASGAVVFERVFEGLGIDLDYFVADFFVEAECPAVGGK